MLCKSLPVKCRESIDKRIQGRLIVKLGASRSSMAMFQTPSSDRSAALANPEESGSIWMDRLDNGRMFECDEIPNENLHRN